MDGILPVPPLRAHGSATHLLLIGALRLRTGLIRGKAGARPVLCRCKAGRQPA